MIDSLRRKEIVLHRSIVFLLFTVGLSLQADPGIHAFQSVESIKITPSSLQDVQFAAPEIIIGHRGPIFRIISEMESPEETELSAGFRWANGKAEADSTFTPRQFEFYGFQGYTVEPLTEDIFPGNPVIEVHNGKNKGVAILKLEDGSYVEISDAVYVQYLLYMTEKGNLNLESNPLMIPFDSLTKVEVEDFLKPKFTLLEDYVGEITAMYTWEDHVDDGIEHYVLQLRDNTYVVFKEESNFKRTRKSSAE